MRGNILFSLSVLFWHCTHQHNKVLIKVVLPFVSPAHRWQYLRSQWISSWYPQHKRLKCRPTLICVSSPNSYIVDSIFRFSILYQVSSSPSPSLPSPCYILWLQSWTQPSEEQKIIRRENCSWHYFWKAGYCNGSRAGIHCVWGSDWKPLVFGGCLREAQGEKAELAESFNACGNRALRGQGRGVFNNGRSQGFSWVTNSDCSRLTHTHLSLLSLSIWLPLCPISSRSRYEFRGMLSSHRSKLSSLALWTCWSGSGSFVWARHSDKMNKCFVQHRPSLKQRQAAGSDKWGIKCCIFLQGCWRSSTVGRTEADDAAWILYLLNEMSSIKKP